MKAVLLIDDVITSDVIAFYLQREGFETIVVQNNGSALDRLRIESPDLIMLDLEYSVSDVLLLCKSIRVQTDTPLIVLCRNIEEDETIRGLELGADDYIIKPFSPRLMMARIKALLRRTISLEPGPDKLVAADLVLDCSRRQIHRDGQLIADLTRQECRLLEILIRNSGYILPLKTLINHVWGPSRGDRLMLKKLISRLRHKLAADQLKVAHIETISGIGYRFDRILAVSDK